jgi:tol-pal system protein YbgF
MKPGLAVKFLRASLVGSALFVAMGVQAALFGDDEARQAILDLRQRVEAQKQTHDAALGKLSEENTLLRRSLLDLQSQIESLRAEMARMRGQEEQLARDVAELQRRQKDLSQGVDDRLSKLEPIKVSVDGREFLADSSEKREFESALAIFRSGDFAGAQTALVSFAHRHPKSGYNSSVLFWLGNAQYATRDYKEAIANFRSVLTDTPDHLRAPEALLSIANCQIELKDSRAARRTLEDLIKTYPQSEAAQAGKERLSRLR